MRTAAFAFAALLAFLSTASPAAETKPNIVFILADDYGIDGAGCYGSDHFKDRTPNLDALAASGLRFERCYSTPLCGPTRCLMESNFPVDKQSCGYGVLWNALKRITKNCSAAEKAAMYHDTAAQVYRLSF